MLGTAFAHVHFIVPQQDMGINYPPAFRADTTGQLKKDVIGILLFRHRWHFMYLHWFCHNLFTSIIHRVERGYIPLIDFPDLMLSTVCWIISPVIGPECT